MFYTGQNMFHAKIKTQVVDWVQLVLLMRKCIFISMSHPSIIFHVSVDRQMSKVNAEEETEKTENGPFFLVQTNQLSQRFVQ